MRNSIVQFQVFSLYLLQKRNVLTVTINEMFNHFTYDYDVGLLRVEEPFVFNDFVRPVCLPKVDEPIEPSSLCVVTGWGNTGEGDCLDL